MKHKTRIVKSQRPVPASYMVKCDCGWQSQRTAHKSGARRYATGHKRWQQYLKETGRRRTLSEYINEDLPPESEETR